MSWTDDDLRRGEASKSTEDGRLDDSLDPFSIIASCAARKLSITCERSLRLALRAEGMRFTTTVGDAFSSRDAFSLIGLATRGLATRGLATRGLATRGLRGLVTREEPLLALRALV